MLVKREELYNKIKELAYNLNKEKLVVEKTKDINERYGIPLNILSDILSLRLREYQESDFVLFAINDVLAPSSVEKHFTQIEIQNYRNMFYESKTVKFPIKFNMVQVADDQWIGVTSVQQLMEFKEASLIVYNENTQRTLKYINNGDVEYWMIDTNKSEIEAIARSYKENAFIPNTITLNLSEDAEFEYSDGVFTIYSLSNFDITDGFHRYLGMAKNYNLNDKFDYPMELRITAFDEKKARHFIYQEDQKHKMKKVDSDGMNQQNNGNKVALNVIKSSLLSDRREIVNMGILGKTIDETYFNKSNVRTSDILKAQKKIISCLDELITEKPEILDSVWDTKFIVAAIYCSKVSENYVEDLYKLYDLMVADKELLKRREVSKSQIAKIAKLYEGMVV